MTDHIDCAHLLPGHAKCGRLHGHTYRVEVVVDGPPTGGMVIADLKAQVRSVLSRYDHRHWNDFLDYPTVENICQRLADDLAEKLAFPFSIRVYEGSTPSGRDGRLAEGRGGGR
ncbi:MAG: 6-carboxytetrahydropterin synthase [Vicinamibacteria bacterium]